MSGVVGLTDDVDRVEWCRLKDIKAAFSTFVHRLFEKKVLAWHNQQPMGVLQCVLTGDKGGDTVKMQIIVTNTLEPQVPLRPPYFCLLLNQLDGDGVVE